MTVVVLEMPVMLTLTGTFEGLSPLDALERATASVLLAAGVVKESLEASPLPMIREGDSAMVTVVAYGPRVVSIEEGQPQ